MKSAMYSTLWDIGVLIAVYVGSYYFFVSPMQVGLGAGGVVVWFLVEGSWLRANRAKKSGAKAHAVQNGRWLPLLYGIARSFLA